MSLRLSRERFCLHPNIRTAPNKAEACEEATKIAHNGVAKTGRAFDFKNSGCTHLDKAEKIGYPRSTPPPRRGLGDEAEAPLLSGTRSRAASGRTSATAARWRCGTSRTRCARARRCTCARSTWRRTRSRRARASSSSRAAPCSRSSSTRVGDEAEPPPAPPLCRPPQVLAARRPDDPARGRARAGLRGRGRRRG